MVASVFGADQVRTGVYPAAPSDVFIDYFDRPNGPLGNGWINISEAFPDDFNPCGINNDAACILDPHSRPPSPGQLPGIGAAYQETTLTAVTVTAKWIGDIGLGEHINEGGPAINFALDTPQVCIGVWPSFLDPTGILFIGGIMNPPETFDQGLLGYALYTHDTTQPHIISMTSNGTHIIDVQYDGVSKQLVKAGDNIAVDSLAIPESMIGSTSHGMVIDSHLDIELPTPCDPAIEWITIQQAVIA